MKLTFKMTADEFYRGFNFKTSKLGMNETCELVCLTVFLVLAAILTFTGVLKDTFLLILSIMLMLFFVFKMIMTKNSVMNDFQRSPILNEENTLIGSFEKVYAPWKSVYAVKETKKELIILPTLSRGVAVISKERYKNELEEIIKILKSKGVMK